MQASKYNNYPAAALAISLIILAEILLGLGSIVLPAYIPLTGVLILVLFIVACVRLHWGLYLLIFTVPLSFAHFVFYNKYAPHGMLETNSSFHFSIIFLIIFLLAWLVRTCSGRIDKKSYIIPGKGFVPGPIPIFLVLLICWNALSLFWTPNLVIGFIHYVKLLANIGIFCLFYYCIDSSDTLKRVAWTSLFFGVFLSIICFYTFYGIDFSSEFTQEFRAGKTSAMLLNFRYTIYENIRFFAEWSVHRSRGTAFMHPAQLGSTMNFLIAIGTGLLLSTKKEEYKKRSVLILILILLVSCQFTTLSRAATASLFGMVFIFLVFIRKLREKFIRNSLIIVFGFLMLFLIVQNEQIFGIAVKRLSSSGQETSLTMRLEWWTGVLNLFSKSLVTGLGIGASYFYLYPTPHIHNIYLSILCDMGFFGFLLFGLFIVMICKEALLVIKSQKTFLQYMMLASCGAMLALAAQGLLDFHYNDSRIWMIMGICMAAFKLARQEAAGIEAVGVKLSGVPGLPEAL